MRGSLLTLHWVHRFYVSRETFCENNVYRLLKRGRWRMSSTNKGRNPESFGDAFRQAARESLVKNQRKRRSDIVSIAPIQLALAALAIGIYALWNSWLCLIPLGVVLVLMWVRYTAQRWRDRRLGHLVFSQKVSFPPTAFRGYARTLTR